MFIIVLFINFIKFFRFLNVYNELYAAPPPIQSDEILNDSFIKEKSIMSRVFKRRNIEYVDEYQVYLSLPLVDENADILEWWKTNQHQFPNLSRMALNYLAIPATSVPSEQVFSMEKNLITDKRNRLAGKTIRMYLCLKS